MAQPISNLPIGAKVKFGHYEVESEGAMPIIWTIVAKNHPGYPANSITLQTEKIIDLRCFDAREPDNPNTDRKGYGNNRYSVSNIDQWLNKAGSAAGGWYVAQHDYDQSPNAANVSHNTPYDTRPGFLYHFSTQERNAILSTTLRVAKPSVDGGGYEDITRRVFLPSATEVGLGDEGGIAEGTAWGFYTSGAARIAYLTAQAFNNTLSDFKPSTIDEDWYWWLRTPLSSNAEHVRAARTGTLSGLFYARDGSIGVRPALNLSSFTLVSDTTDADGCYTFVPNTPPTKPSHINVPAPIYRGGTAVISWGASTDVNNNLSGYILQRSVNEGDYTEIFKGNALTYTDTIAYGWNTVRYRVCAYDALDATSDWQESDIRTVINNQAPVISGSDANLGVKSAEFTQSYTVTDAEGDSVTVTEKIDGVPLRSYNVTLGATNTFSVTGTTWLALSNGSHTMTITATDSFGSTTVRTYTFTKSVNSFSIQNASPMMADTRPSRIKITVTRNIPPEATFKVYVCNNGYDSVPTWEDATSSVTGNLIHIFENTTKTADSWGVLIKVEVDRGLAEGACYVSQIGGNFE